MLPSVSLLFFLARGPVERRPVDHRVVPIGTSFCQHPEPLGKCNQRSRAQTASRAPGGAQARALARRERPGRSNTHAVALTLRGASCNPQGPPRATPGTREASLRCGRRNYPHPTCAARPPAARRPPSRRPPARRHSHHPHKPRGATRRFVYGPRPHLECTHYQGTTLVSSERTSAKSLPPSHQQALEPRSEPARTTAPAIHNALARR